jgi:GTP-binding protein TrmE N-terminus
MRRCWHALGRSSLGHSRPLAMVMPTRNAFRSAGIDLHRLTIKLHFGTFAVSPPLVLSDAQRRTIYALSTPPGRAAVAVIRISGPDALEIWKQTVRTSQTRAQGEGVVPEAWKMHRCRIVDPHTGEMLDDALAVFFKGKLERSLVTDRSLLFVISSKDFYNRRRGRVPYPLGPRRCLFCSWNAFSPAILSAGRTRRVYPTSI